MAVLSMCGQEFLAFFVSAWRRCFPGLLMKLPSTCAPSRAQRLSLVCLTRSNCPAMLVQRMRLFLVKVTFARQR